MSDSSLRAVAEQRVGQVIKGKYRVESVLGMGGMAVVYAVTHVRNNARLAVKMLHPELSIRDDIRQRFLREGYAGNSVAHPGVVMVVDDDMAEDGAVFIVMERLYGISVEQLSETHGKQMAVPSAIAIVDQLLDVLQAAHDKGIIHRDIKPANLFLTRDGTVKVLDFGIARVRDALVSTGGQMTNSGVLMGTPAFMSPEQALAKSSEIDARSDVWAAGATLFALISGRVVHEADNAPQMLVKVATQPAPSLSSVVPGVPAQIVEVVARSLAQERDARYPSAAAMRTALRTAQQAAYGTQPSRDILEAFFQRPSAAQGSERSPAASTAAHAQTFPVGPPAPTGTLPVLRYTPQPVAAVGGSTEQPVSRVPAAPSRGFPRAAAYLGALVGVVGIAVVGVVAVTRHAPALATAPSTATATAMVTSTATVTVTSTSTSTSISGAAGIPISQLPPLATNGATVKPAVSVAVAPVVASKPAASAASKPSCDPAYTLDSLGHRVYKPECL